jgi:hypothetical protein
MQVYGSIPHDVINIMGVAIMEAQHIKHLRGLLLPCEWGEFMLHYKLSVSIYTYNSVSFFNHKHHLFPHVPNAQTSR